MGKSVDIYTLGCLLHYCCTGSHPCPLRGDAPDCPELPALEHLPLLQSLVRSMLRKV